MATCARYANALLSCQSNFSTNTSETLKNYCFGQDNYASSHSFSATFYATNKVPKIYTKKNEQTVYLNGIQMFKVSKENNPVASVPFFAGVNSTSELNYEIPAFRKLIPLPPQTVISFYYPTTFYPTYFADIGSIAGSVALNYAGNAICSEKNCCSCFWKLYLCY